MLAVVTSARKLFVNVFLQSYFLLFFFCHSYLRVFPVSVRIAFFAIHNLWGFVWKI